MEYKDIIIKEIFEIVAEENNYNVNSKLGVYKTYSKIKLITSTQERDKDLTKRLFYTLCQLPKSFKTKESYIKYLDESNGLKRDLIYRMDCILDEIKYYR